MYPEAVLFDLDDTILSDDVASEEAWNETCRRFAAGVKGCGPEELFEHVNRVRTAYWSDPDNLRSRAMGRELFQSRLTIVRTALRELGVQDDGLAAAIVDTYREVKTGLLRFCPNATETIAGLTQRGIKLGLLTNGDAEGQRVKIRRFDLDRYFPVCLVEGELGFGKPDPRIYRLAIERLGTEAQRTWMVGDRLEFDIAGAKAAGMFGILAVYGRDESRRPSGVKPDAVIRDISELLMMVDKGNSKSRN